MLTLQECLDLSGLENEAVDVIAHHERIPEIVAAELGHQLLATAAGRRRIHDMIVDDIGRARATGDEPRSLALQRVLSHYDAAHP
jgi:hypothetical protein